MTPITVTDDLLHQLVTGSYAEGTTRLAVAAAIEHHDRTLLIGEIDDDFETNWQLPGDLVLPGETLLQGLDRTVSLTTGLGVVDVTGYAGHHDRLDDDQVIRTFVFIVTVNDPERICRWFLLNAPEYRARIRSVWLWSDWPGTWGRDAGIDLVAEEHDGGLGTEEAAGVGA